jgi:hypothetical protein
MRRDSLDRRTRLHWREEFDVIGFGRIGEELRILLSLSPVDNSSEADIQV